MPPQIRQPIEKSSHIPPLESFNDTHLALHEVYVNGHENIYLNYGVWLETQDLEKSRSAVSKDWKKTITGNLFQRLRRSKNIDAQIGFYAITPKRGLR